MKRTAADAIVEALMRHGVQTMMGQSLPSALFLAAERAGIRQLVYRTENAGGAIADGFARIGNTLGVVGAQNGPAATLLVAPLTEAKLVSIPILALVQDVPTPTQDRNAFQEIDHFALFDGCSKWTRRLTDAARAEEYIDMAINAAMSGRPGPAVLLLPKDVLITEVPASPRPRTTALGTFPVDRPRPSTDSVERAAALIAEAESPLIVAGGGVHRSQASEQVARLQDLASVPVATTNMGKGAVDERHPLSMGVIGNAMADRSTTRFMRDIVAESDLVVFVGSRTNENATDSWKIFPSSATYIHLDVDGAEIGRNYESVRVVGDARSSLDDLLVALETHDLAKRTAARAGVEAKIAAAREAHAEQFAELVDLDAVPIRPERVIHELNQVLDSDAIVAADASYSTIWLANYLTAKKPGQRFLYPRGMAGLGWGFPLALGAQVVEPESTVVCVTGDGGFGHVWGELETAVRSELPVVVILLNNSILGFQRHSELFQFGDHTSAISFATVDHGAIARACGANAIRVDDPNDIKSAIEGAIASRRPTLIEVMVDPDAYPPISLWETKTELLASSRLPADR